MTSTPASRRRAAIVWTVGLLIAAASLTAYLVYRRVHCCDSASQLIARSPLRDLRRVVKCGCFLGKTRRQIIEQFGDAPAPASMTPQELVYTTGQTDSYFPIGHESLAFRFEHEVVVEVVILPGGIQ